MRQYDTYHDGVILRYDTRLIRQSLENWDKKELISDDKFIFIDEYVRRQAVTGEDSQVTDSVRIANFQEQATAIAKIYVRSAKYDWMYPQETSIPRTFYCESVSGTWYRSLFVRIDELHEMVDRVIVGYMPDDLQNLSLDRYDEIVFYEGFLIPLVHDRREEGNSVRIWTICMMKLVRPENRGLTSTGYADGEVTFATLYENEEMTYASIMLEHPNPVSCPTVSYEWIAQKYAHSEDVDVRKIHHLKSYHPAMGIRSPDATHNNRGRLNLVYNKDLDDKVESIIKLSYKGYVY